MTRLHSFSETLDFIQLAAQLQVTNERILSFKIKLQGDANKVYLPTLLPPLLRVQKTDLWRETCFEFFISEGKEKGNPYIEFNLSPAGHWDLYFFDAYRQGMRRLQAILHVTASADHQWNVDIELNEPIPFKPQYLNLTSVIKTLENEISYWAPAHPREKADFHDKSVWGSF